MIPSAAAAGVWADSLFGTLKGWLTCEKDPGNVDCGRPACRLYRLRTCSDLGPCQEDRLWWSEGHAQDRARKEDRRREEDGARKEDGGKEDRARKEDREGEGEGEGEVTVLPNPSPPAVLTAAFRFAAHAVTFVSFSEHCVYHSICPWTSWESGQLGFCIPQIERMVLVKKLIALALVMGSLIISAVGCGPATTTGPKTPASTGGTGK